MTDLAHRGRQLEYFTIGYNSLEGAASIIAGVIAGSIALVGFGFDSLIEVTSGAALLWRLRAGLTGEQGERAERIALRIVGACFLIIAAYVIVDSAKSLLRRDAPHESIIGIVIAAVSVVVMPMLVRAKRRVADALSSGALRADAKQTEICTYLSAILLAGLGLNALFGWWWADPVAALVMTPIIIREGIEGLRGEACSDDCHSVSDHEREVAVRREVSDGR